MMQATHIHSYNGLPHHWDGEQWWYLSPSRGKWVLAEFLVPAKLIEL
ncbi:hypothetical protein [Vibrio parahaemolyticus]|nr:hypothetical protein [Vibrio parahaemolyticus]